MLENPTGTLTKNKKRLRIFINKIEEGEGKREGTRGKGRNKYEGDARWMLVDDYP